MRGTVQHCTVMGATALVMAVDSHVAYSCAAPCATHLCAVEPPCAGVGISGQEGMQAVMSSDFAIAQVTALSVVHFHIQQKTWLHDTIVHYIMDVFRWDCRSYGAICL